MSRLYLWGASVIAVFAVLYGVYSFGQRSERASAEIRESKKAIQRLNDLEKNNAAFRNLSPRHRCLEFMRDSGLSEDNCEP